MSNLWIKIKKPTFIREILCEINNGTFKVK